jgi:hypothetical protein
MSKANDFIRELHAEVSPIDDEDSGRLGERAGVALTEVELRRAEALAAVSKMKLSKLIRVSIRRTLREARDAGVLSAEMATPA